MANTFRRETYRPTTVVAYTVIALLAIIGIISLFYFILSIGMIAFPDTTLDLDDVGSINASLFAMSLIGLLEVPLRIACAVAFLIWLYKAFANLSPLKARNLEFSPGWAVGWWFIPFANLVKPFQVARELYNESDPDADLETGFSHGPAGTPEIVGLWWATFLVSRVADRVANVLYGRGDLPASDYFPVAFMVAGILSAVAAGLAITLVWTVTKRQDARASRVAAASGISDLPPPPTFYGGYETV